jgi:osmotically-inducible protein OsmY
MDAGNRRGRTVALLALAAALLAAPLLASSDAELKSRIEERLAKAGIAQNADIHVSVEDGVVRLTGIAVRYVDFRDAERLARKEADRVINTVRVVPEKTRSDQAIKADVEAAILRWASYERFDAVGVEVKRGVVRLTGWVDHPWKRDAVETQVARVDGIRDVLADLRVQGFANSDVELRLEIFTRIYTDPLFERYSANPIDPPIRVFVDRGRVTLAGTVSSKVEKAMAGHIARSTLAFSVDNRVQVRGEKAREEDRSKDRSKDPDPDQS